MREKDKAGPQIADHFTPLSLVLPVPKPDQRTEESIGLVLYEL